LFSSMPGHEYLHEIASRFSKAGLEVDVVHHSPDPSLRSNPFKGVRYPSHDWHAIFHTTEIPKSEDPVVRAAHFVLYNHVFTPHAVSLGENAYWALRNELLRRFGRDSEIYKYFTEHTKKVEVRGGKRVYLAGLPHFVDGKVYHPVKYSPERPHFAMFETLLEVYRRNKSFADVREFLEKSGYKHVLQGEYAILDRSGPRYVGTSQLNPCVSVVIHDVKNGRTYLAHIDDGQHFGHWKKVLEEWEKEKKGKYHIYFVGANLKDPFVVGKKSAVNGKYVEGYVHAGLVNEIRQHIQELQSKGVDVGKIGFLHTSAFAYDREQDVFHPLDMGFAEVAESFIHRAYKEVPERRAHISEGLRPEGRKTLYRV